MLAIAEVMAEKGYVATSVADIVAHAGVSRKTFYELFDDRLDCFMAANRQAQEILLSTMSEQLKVIEQQRELDDLSRISALTEAYLQTLFSFPKIARVFLVEVYAAGPEAIALRRDALDRFVDLFVPSGDPEERVVSEMLVAAVSTLVTNAVGTGDVEAIASIHGKVMTMVERLSD
jgi:AcrR family transcriptional regulator